MPRHNRRSVDGFEDRAGPKELERRRDEWNGREYEVRTVLGSAGSKPYRCPGCDQLISNTNHLVAWPVDDIDAEDRRHWHRACWSARGNRRPGVQRGRAAPRY